MRPIFIALFTIFFWTEALPQIKSDSMPTVEPEMVDTASVIVPPRTGNMPVVNPEDIPEQQPVEPDNYNEKSNQNTPSKKSKKKNKLNY